MNSQRKIKPIDHLWSIPSSPNEPAIPCYHSVELARLLTHLNNMYLDYLSRGHRALSHYLPLALSAFSELLGGKSSKGSRIATHMPRYKVYPVQNLICWLMFVPWILFQLGPFKRKANKQTKTTPHKTKHAWTPLLVKLEILSLSISFCFGT